MNVRRGRARLIAGLASASLICTITVPLANSAAATPAPAALASAEVATAPNARPTAPADSSNSLLPWDKIGTVAGAAWPYILNCYKNETDKDPKTHCLTPAPTIRTILTRIDALEKKIDSQFASLNARVDKLESDLAYDKLAADQATLISLQSHGDQAFAAWEALLKCLAASAPKTEADAKAKPPVLPKNPKCRTANGTVDVDAKVGAEQSRQKLLDEVKAIPADKGSPTALKGLFGGLEGGSLTANRGFVWKLWDLHRLNQNQLASAKDAYKQTGVHTLPIITYNLATQFNEELDIYRAVVHRWAYFSILAKSITEPATVVNTLTDDFNGLVLNPARVNSAAYVGKQFKLPKLNQQETIVMTTETVAGKEVKKAKIVGIAAYRPGSQTMSLFEVKKLSAVWSTYGDVELASTRMKNSFPSGRLYSVNVPVKKQVAAGCASGGTWATCKAPNHTEITNVHVFSPASAPCVSTVGIYNTVQPRNPNNAPFPYVGQGSKVAGLWIGDTWASSKFFNAKSVDAALAEANGGARIGFTWQTISNPGPENKVTWGSGIFIKCLTVSRGTESVEIPTPLMMAP